MYLQAEQDMATQQSTLEALQQERSAAEAQNNQLRDSVSQAQQVAGEMEQKLEESKLERQRAEEQLAAQKRELEELQLRASSAQGNIAENTEYAEAMQKQLSAANAEVKQGEDLQAVISEILKDEAAASNQRYSELEDRMNEEIERKHKVCLES